VFDDHVLVESSPLLRGPLWKIWIGASAFDYWPLTWTSLWVEWRLFGSDPLGYHAVNLALHVVTALVLWRALRALRIPGAWLAALLFAVHPATVESAAWVSERKNVLSAPLYLGAILAFVRYDASRRGRALAASLALFALALLAKTSVVMLPFVLLGIVLWRRGRIDRRAWVDAAPFFALSLAAGAVTLWFQWSRAMQEYMLPPRGIAERIGGAGWALASYLQKAFVPVGVGVVYADWPVGPASPLFWAPLAALLALAALLWSVRRTPARPLLFAFGHHAVVLLPVLGLVDMAYFGVGPVGNHLQYLALMGASVLVAAGLARLSAGRRRALALALSGALVAVCAAMTFVRAGSYHDDFTLWRAAAEASPQSLWATWRYADALADRGRFAEGLAELDRLAAQGADEATRLRARSLASMQRRRSAEAVADAAAADRLRPHGEFDLTIGELLIRAGRPADAAPILSSLVARAPRNLDFRYSLGAALTQTGRGAEALELLRGSCRIAPDDARSREALALLLVRTGAVAEAREHVAVLLGTDPRDPAVDARLAVLAGASR